MDLFNEPRCVLPTDTSANNGTGPPVLAVIVPVYNEARTVERLLDLVLVSPYVAQVIVVDDGSTDGTTAILRRLRRGKVRVEVVFHSSNRGKGAAIRSGLECARARFTIIQDADLEYDPSDYGQIVEPLLSGEATVVFGSRYLRRGRIRFSRWRPLRCGVMILNLCVRVLYGQWLTDEATCYKAFSTDLLKSLDLKCERFEFCPEVTAKVSRLGLRIVEVPISYDARTVQAGKKIRWTDGLTALGALWKWRKWEPAKLDTFAARSPLAGDLPRKYCR